jgi:hypothetical protein
MHHHSPGCFAWGWLREQDHELLRILGDFGIHCQPISLTVCGRTDEACCEDIVRIGEQMELLMLRPVSVFPVIDIFVADLSAQRQQLH